MAQRELERFERIVLPHLDDAYTLARYLLRDEHDAQDVVQEAALRALRYIDGYGGGDPRAWLLAIVRNCTIDWQRRAQGERRMVSLDEHPPVMSDGPASDAEAIRASERRRIEQAMASLPIEFREVIVLREIEGLAYKEIGEVVGAPIGTVMSRLARARKRLAELLGDGAREVV
jgi:RNA polymerase sigma-70 factor (ECF subfamily)